MNIEDAKDFEWFNSCREEIYDHIDKIYEDFKYENKCDGCKNSPEHNGGVYHLNCGECKRFYSDMFEAKTIA